MKKKPTIILAVLASLFGASAGYCTANAAEPASSLDAGLADTSTLGLLCKGAGVDIADARWRVEAGLDPELAVQAALAQKQLDADAAKAATSKKGGK